MTQAKSADIGAFFAAGGPLAQSVASYEPRPGQVELACAVGAALCSFGKLVAEAGTGIGKTLAYLVPSVLLGRRVLISTATKALQTQLMRDDVPSLERALGRPIEVVALKGRLNYLCERRAESVLMAGSLVPSEANKLATVAAWRRQTRTGDRADCAGLGEQDEALWRRLTASSEQCDGRRCTFFERCWLKKARERAQEADVTVVNHHLFFADAALQTRDVDSSSGAVSLLPTADALIFDEAHELSHIASQHFGAHVERAAAAALLGEVSTFATANEQPKTSALAHRALGHMEAALDALPLADKATPLTLTPGSLLASDCRQAAEQAFAALVSLTGQLAEQKGGEALFWSRRTQSMAEQLALCFGLIAEPASNPLVRWAEASTADPAGAHRQLTAARVLARPLEVADLLRATIGEIPAVFVSATLRENDSFAHVKAELGASQATELLVDSPFDWQAQAVLYLPDDLPLPGTPDFDQKAARRAAELVCASGGGAFILCTSRRAMRAMEAACRAAFGGTVLVQGEGPKESTLAAFAADGNAVLIATMGFWQGVDVKGPALRLVIIDRIPFAPPDSPMVAARIAQIESYGQDPFKQLQLPQAALLLRQATGRLLRSSSDRGVVAILDGRLSKRRYGRQLLRSLPSCPMVHEKNAIVWPHPPRQGVPALGQVNA